MHINKWSLLVVVTVAAWMCRGGVMAADPLLVQQCSSKLTAMMICVDFATGKDATPQKKCCDSVKEMKDSNPACLCFLIQQIHNGTNPMLKKINVQEGRMLQLSSACNIANASISDCPKLLKLPSDSPDAAIFTNNATTVAPTSGGSTPSSTAITTSKSHAAKFNAPGILQSTWIPLTIFSLVLSSTSVFYV